MELLEALKSWDGYKTISEVKKPDGYEARLKETVDLLLTALTDSEADVRSAAAKSLVMLGDRRAIKSLEKAFETESDKKVKETIKESLSSLKE